MAQQQKQQQPGLFQQPISISLPPYQAPQSQFFGGQHGSGFKEMSRDSAAKIELLHHTLQKQLGPEWVATRPGPGNGAMKLSYIEGSKALALANEIFGFNGWSSQIMSLAMDFCDMHGEQSSDRWNVSFTAIIRVTLRDGTFHEDVGSGHAENVKGKAAALAKVRKEAVTDAVKRALRSFGNVLGNCLYDKNYLKDIQKVPSQPIKFNKDNLYRHRDFDPNFAANSAPNFTTSRPHPDNAATRYRHVAAAQPTAGPCSRPLNEPPLHRTAMANAMHADSLAAGESITRPDTSMLWQSVDGQDDEAMYAAAMDMVDGEDGDVLESFPLDDCVILEEEEIEMGIDQGTMNVGPRNDVLPPPAPPKMTDEERARGQAKRRAALQSFSPTKNTAPIPNDAAAQKGGCEKLTEMPRGEAGRPARSAAGFRFPDGKTAETDRHKAGIPNNIQASTLRAQIIGAALNEAKSPAVRETSETNTHSSTGATRPSLHQMDKIAANANAALRAQGLTGVENSGIGFVSARGVKRASPAGDGDGFGLAVDRGGDPSNQDLGLRKVLGELNAADLPFEPGSKRSRN